MMSFHSDYTTEEGIIHASLVFRAIMRITTIDNIAATVVFRDNNYLF